MKSTEGLRAEARRLMEMADKLSSSLFRKKPAAGYRASTVMRVAARPDPFRGRSAEIQ